MSPKNVNAESLHWSAIEPNSNRGATKSSQTTYPAESSPLKLLGNILMTTLSACKV